MLALAATFSWGGGGAGSRGAGGNGGKGGNGWRGATGVDVWRVGGGVRIEGGWMSASARGSDAGGQTRCLHGQRDSGARE